MANTLKIKRSAVQGKVPTTADLDLGELGVNTYDGKLYMKKDDGTASVIEIGAGGGGAGIEWQSVKTANFTALANQAYPVNTTSGSITATLPASPLAGQTIVFVDYAGTWNSSKLKFNLNGNKINGSTTTTVVSGVERGAVNLVYIDSTQGWITYAGYTGAPTYLPDTFTTDFLVVAGGGGGGRFLGSATYASAGGGAGGYRTSAGTSGGGASAESSLTLSPATSYTVTVGAGGAMAFQGSNSVFSTITSTAGGSGAPEETGVATRNGGSGGGAGDPVGTGGQSAGTGISGQGFGGGAAGGQGTAGGGGGAGAAGSNNVGGTGVASAITGSSVFRAGGGTGGTASTVAGGAGGGGTGGPHDTATAGTANTGGGGGGTRGPNASTQSGKPGGSGVVIIKYPDSFTLSNPGGGLTFSTTSSGGFKVTTFTAGTGNIQFG
jgi:hypothetical protein